MDLPWSGGNHLFERLKADNQDYWERYCSHPFVQGIGDGTLPVENFRHYLRQDYVFLLNYTRAWALAVYKASDISHMRRAAHAVDKILNQEVQLHINYSEKWGESVESLASTPEAQANMAYTRYVLEKGFSGDLLDLHIALTPCSIGYAEVGQRLAQSSVADNPYQDWIDTYAGESFQEAVGETVTFLDELAESGLSVTRYEQLSKTFRQATHLEIGFWEMGLTLAD